MPVMFTACGEKNADSGTDKTYTVLQKAISENAKKSELLTGELENKTIKWLSAWDINSGDNNGKSTPAFLVAFQERYGGKIEWYQCTHEERYEQLAKAINGNEGSTVVPTGSPSSVHIRPQDQRPSPAGVTAPTPAHTTGPKILCPGWIPAGMEGFAGSMGW